MTEALHDLTLNSFQARVVLISIRFLNDSFATNTLTLFSQKIMSIVQFATIYNKVTLPILQERSCVHEMCSFIKTSESNEMGM